MKIGNPVVHSPPGFTAKIVRTTRKSLWHRFWARFWAWYGIGTGSIEEEIGVDGVVQPTDELAMRVERKD